MSNNYGLNDSYQYVEFELDSLDAITAAQANSSRLDWPLFTINRQLTHIAAMKIVEVQIPFSYYIFNAQNNTFLLTESDGGGAVVVTIPVGNYTSTTMIVALAAALNAVSANGHTYTVTFTAATQKFTVTSNAGGVKTFTFTFGVLGDGQNTNPSVFLGFNAGANVSTTGQVLAAPDVALITGPNYLYVNSQKHGQLCGVFLPKGALNLGSGNIGPQMAKVPVNCQPGGVIYWQDPIPLMWFDFGDLPNLADIDIFLTAGNSSAQTPLQLNGQGFSIKLGVLLSRLSVTDVFGSGTQNDRVVKRIRPA